MRGSFQCLNKLESRVVKHPGRRDRSQALDIAIADGVKSCVLF